MAIKALLLLPPALNSFPTPCLLWSSHADLLLFLLLGTPPPDVLASLLNRPLRSLPHCLLVFAQMLPLPWGLLVSPVWNCSHGRSALPVPRPCVALPTVLIIPWHNTDATFWLSIYLQLEFCLLWFTAGCQGLEQCWVQNWHSVKSGGMNGWLKENGISMSWGCKIKTSKSEKIGTVKSSENKRGPWT